MDAVERPCLDLEVAESDEDWLLGELWGHGTEGIESLETVPGRVRLRAHFPGDRLDLVHTALTAALAARGTEGRVERAQQPVRDWVAEYQAGLEPLVAGPFLVDPTGEAPADGAELVLRLRPGAAFGTGEHATTRMLLELLGELPCAGRSGLDVGAGSGILAMAMALRGASGVVAYDIDATAVEVARHNVGRNGLDDRVVVDRGDLFADAPTAPGGYDLVVANLNGALLVRGMARLVAVTADGGELLLSGILAEQESAVVGAARSAGLELTARREGGAWVALHCARSAGGARSG